MTAPPQTPPLSPPLAGEEDASGGGTPLLQVTGLTRYYGARIGCREVDFDLWPGEVMGVVGESGSGETVLRLIEEAKARGAAIVGIFHDRAVRARAADREVDVRRFHPAPTGGVA
jgi:ABC-type phosphonate transport system ATPase subunit